MAFNLKQNDDPKQVHKTIGNSSVLRIGEAVTMNTSGFAVTCPAGTVVYGVVQGITKNNGGTPTTNGAGADFSPYGDFTVAADNQTVDKYKVLVETSKTALYSAPASATLGTTTGSNIEGYHMDHTSGALILDEATSITGSAQWLMRGLDPSDTTRALVNIFESQIDS